MNYKEIRRAMLRWERKVLNEIKKANKAGHVYYGSWNRGMASHRAEERLEKKGLIKYVKVSKKWKAGSFGQSYGRVATAYLTKKN